jgi:hypothetical protein
MTGLYYLQNDQGDVQGPFRAEQLREMAGDGRLRHTWQVSTDRTHWVAATEVGGLFADDLARKRAEMTAVFLEHFVFENENYRTSFPWMKALRARWALLILPRQFLLAHAAGPRWEYVRYDLADGRQEAAEAAEVDRTLSDAVRRFPWFTLLVGLLALVWLVSVVRHFTLASAVIKALLLAVPAVAASVLRTKGSKVFLGYILDRDARSRLQAVRNAFGCLRHSSKVWLCELHGHGGAADWALTAGAEASAGKLPVPVFGRPIPNVETNVRVRGFAARDKAVYFLPEKILVIDGGQVRFVDYMACTIVTGALVYPELEGKVYPDAEPAGKRYRHVTADGGPDPRFADNPQVPLLRFGRLRLDVGTTRVELLTTNPRVPELFREHFFSTPAVTTFSPAHGDVAPVGEPAAAPALPDYGEPGGNFWQRLGEKAWPVLRALKNNVPAKAWLAVAGLAVLVVVVGSLVSLIFAADRDVERADQLYDEGRRAEAVALYARHPDRFWKHNGAEVRNLRRVIEFELERGDAVEARKWIDRAVERGVPLDFNSPAAANLYAAAKAERDRRLAQEAEEAAARQRAREAEEERKRKIREDEEEFKRLATEAAEKRAKELEKEEARRREEEEIKRTLAEAKKRVEDEEARKRAALAKADAKAAPYLRYAIKLIDEGMKEKGMQRLREVIRDYPGTPSAEEAKKLLKVLEDR